MDTLAINCDGFILGGGIFLTLFFSIFNFSFPDNAASELLLVNMYLYIHFIKKLVPVPLVCFVSSYNIQWRRLYFCGTHLRTKSSDELFFFFIKVLQWLYLMSTKNILEKLIWHLTHETHFISRWNLCLFFLLHIN